MHIPPWWQKIFKFIVLILENTFASLKIQSRPFCSCPSVKTFPQVFIIIPQAEGNNSFPQTQKGGLCFFFLFMSHCMMCNISYFYLCSDNKSRTSKPFWRKICTKKSYTFINTWTQPLFSAQFRENTLKWTLETIPENFESTLLQNRGGRQRDRWAK